MWGYLVTSGTEMITIFIAFFFIHKGPFSEKSTLYICILYYVSLFSLYVIFFYFLLKSGKDLYQFLKFSGRVTQSAFFSYEISVFHDTCVIYS